MEKTKDKIHINQILNICWNKYQKRSIRGLWESIVESTSFKKND